MGDVIKSFPVRSYEGEKPRRLRLYFDTGSPKTFIKWSACRGLKDVFTLSKPMAFGGLGNGRFLAARFANLEVRLLGLWCRHAAYVVPDEVLEERYDLLVGHDFMQNFDIAIAPKRRGLILDRGALKMAQTVRRADRPPGCAARKGGGVGKSAAMRRNGNGKSGGDEWTGIRPALGTDTLRPA